MFRVNSKNQPRIELPSKLKKYLEVNLSEIYSYMLQCIFNDKRRCVQ